MNADTVKTFLNEHPEFLDSYIEQHIHLHTLEQWMSKKTQHRLSTSPTTTTTIPIVSSSENNLSKTTVKNDGKNENAENMAT